jgi:hypothetical protein
MATSPSVDLARADSEIRNGAPRVPSRTKMVLILGLLVALGPLTIDMYLPALPTIADLIGPGRTKGAWLSDGAATLPLPAVSQLNSRLLRYFVKR